MSEDMRPIKVDVAELKIVMRRVAMTLADFREEVREGFQLVATKDEVHLLKRSIDGLSGRIDDMRYDWAKHDARLADLEKRRA